MIDISSEEFSIDAGTFDLLKHREVKQLIKLGRKIRKRRTQRERDREKRYAMIEED